MSNDALLETRSEAADAIWLAGIVCGCALASHLSMSAWIAWNDLSGRWHPFRLHQSTARTWRTYAQFLPSLCVNFACVLFPAIFFFGIAYHDAVFSTPEFVSHLVQAARAERDPALNLLRAAPAALAFAAQAVANNVLNRLYAMFAHWLFHQGRLYRVVHKRHHCLLAQLVATEAWNDTIAEFISMEVLGVFLFAQLFFPMHWSVMALTALYNGAAAAIDHSGFHVPGTLVDGRYHYNHHAFVNGNYAEMETLDRFFGTLIEPPAASSRPSAPARTPAEARSPRRELTRRADPAWDAAAGGIPRSPSSGVLDPARA